MLDIKQIKEQYPSNLHRYDRGLLREYLQYLILSILFSHKKSVKLRFLGGTCLRIVHGLPRFSEDLDFDNKDLDLNDFKKLTDYVSSELEKRGFVVETRFIKKGAFHFYIKFPELLFKHGLSPLKEEKILIQLDTFDQGVDYEANTFILNKFGLLDRILVTPKDVILAQKLWTITERNRLKGRDFYDIMFLLQTTEPNEKFLMNKFAAGSLKEALDVVMDSISNADFEVLAEDVRPFLINPSDAEKLVNFKEFLKQEFGL